MDEKSNENKGRTAIQGTSAARWETGVVLFRVISPGCDPPEATTPCTQSFWGEGSCADSATDSIRGSQEEWFRIPA
jgi:hypothetical protein